jgi:hypothetical protein
LVVSRRNLTIVPHHLQLEAEEVKLLRSFAVPAVAEGAVTRLAEDVRYLFSATDCVLDDMFSRLEFRRNLDATIRAV